MKEYVRDAFRALAWARMILSSTKDMTQLKKALTDIQAELKIPEQ